MAKEKTFITCDGNYAAAHVAYMRRMGRLRQEESVRGDSKSNGNAE